MRFQDFSEDIGASPISARNAALKEIMRLGIKTEKHLDIGCGDGDFTMQLAKSVGASLICGVDTSAEALKVASAKGVKTFRIDMSKEWLPLDADSFGMVTAVEVIEHITDTDHFLQEIYRCLRRGGYFVITTPNLASWINRILLLLGYIPAMYDVSFQYRLGKPSRNKMPFRSSHLRLYTLNALVDHLEIHGFKIVSRKAVTMANKKGLVKLLDRALSLIRAYSLLSDLIIIAQK